jgi:hypothetical protein
VIPHWVLKTDPERYPIRFLGSVWQKCLRDKFGIAKTQLTSKEYGQLKKLREGLGDFTRDVVEWIVDPVNWWHFCQFVRAESGLHQVPQYPHIGFLRRQHGRALKVMRHKLGGSTVPADVGFCAKVDALRYKQWKDLAVVYAKGIPARLAKIAAAKTLTDMQQVFIEITDENTAATQ